MGKGGGICRADVGLGESVIMLLRSILGRGGGGGGTTTDGRDGTELGFGKLLSILVLLLSVDVSMRLELLDTVLSEDCCRWLLFAAPLVVVVMAGTGGGRFRLGGKGGEREEVSEESESPRSERGLWRSTWGLLGGGSVEVDIGSELLAKVVGCRNTRCDSKVLGWRGGSAGERKSRRS
jgi:hypothetical protein